MKVHEQDPRAAAMSADWLLIETLLGGTRAMREAGERYLPKWSLETNEDYNARKNIATLFPALAQTIREMTGRVFGSEVVPGDDVPEWIVGEVWPDVDLQDSNGHVFARSWWADGLAMGLSHVLVEAPAAPGVRTQAEQRQTGVRPYCIHIQPKRVLGWKIGTDGELRQVRITWERTEPGEFGDAPIAQIRVYEKPDDGPVFVRVFEERTTGQREREWVEVDQIQTQLDRIPLVTFYTGKTGALTAIPPLRELAYLNCKHWAQQCSTDSLLQTASVPILAASGLSEDSPTLPIGAKSAVVLPVGGTLAFVEHSGKAIGAGRDSLKDLEAQMKAIGAKLIEPGSGSKTATQAGEEAAQANSALAGWVRDFSDAMAALLDMIASLRGEDSGGRVVISADLEPDSVPTETMQILSRMQVQGCLSRQTVFAEAQRRGMVSGDVAWEDEQERIAIEAPARTPEPQGATP